MRLLIDSLMQLIPLPEGTLTKATGFAMIAYGAGGAAWYMLSSGENGLAPDDAVTTVLAGLALIGIRRALPDKE